MICVADVSELEELLSEGAKLFRRTVVCVYVEFVRADRPAAA